jgi:hypothetical protein
MVKTCGECNKDFPKTKDYIFVKVIKQKNKSGFATYYSFRSTCKTCHGKKGNERRVKKRCKELDCNISNYRKNWKKQFSETRTIDMQAKKKLTRGQYSHYRRMVLKGVASNVEEYRKEVFKNKNSKPWLRKFDYEGKVFLTAKERVNKNNSMKIDNLTDIYITNMLGLKKGEVPNELIETKRLIIKIKREVNYGS